MAPQFRNSAKPWLIIILVLPLVSSYRKTFYRERDIEHQPTDLEAINRRDPRVYTNYEVLDQEGKYILEWVVHWKEQRILFNVTVKTKGYVGFGLSRKGLMAGADIVIGGVDSNGEAYFTDRHGVGNSEPVIDESQDWTLHAAWEDKSWTFLSFSRSFDTCDDKDYRINEFDTINLIWSYGEIDKTSQYHFGNRGKYPVYLLDPTTVPPSLQRDSFIPGPPSFTLLAKENLQLWTIPFRYKLLPQDPLYICTMHKAPFVGRKHHMVGFQIRLETPEAVRHVHHILFWRCTPPQNTTSAAFFDRYVNNPGVICHFPTMPQGDLPSQYCTIVKYGFAIGGRISFFPDHYGIPMGESLTDEYYVAQVHYDNPNRVNTDIQFDLDLYYTDRLRPNDAGLMTLGHNIPANPGILIPPSSISHKILGHCGADCTNLMFPPEGIKISLVVLHTHNSGTKVKVRHFRGNRELPWISDDDNYNNLYQDYRILNNEANILPGDHVTVACEYDNTWTNGTVVGGFRTSQEMCLIYNFYYTQLDYTLCRSDITDPQYRRKYLGVNNVTWDNSQFEYVATDPAYLAGLSMSRISDTRVDWTVQLREELQRDHLYLPQTGLCTQSPLTSPGEQTGGNSTVSFPTGVVEYVPPSQRQCPGHSNAWDWRRDKSFGTRFFD